MGTESAITPLQTDSANSLPTGKFTDVRVTEPMLSPSKTNSTSEQNAYANDVVVRGTDQRSVTIHIDVARESVRRKNFIANRGPMQVNTSTGDEG